MGYEIRAWELDGQIRWLVSRTDFGKAFWIRSVVVYIDGGFKSVPKGAAGLTV